MHGKKNTLNSKIKNPRSFFKSQKKINQDIEKLIIKIRKKADIGLHLGAGNSKIDGLINCDLYHPEADKKIDATNLSQFENQSIDLIESHHVIEHFTFLETEKALNEWNRVLHKNGILIITFPDLEKLCLRYLKYSFLYSFLHPLYPELNRLNKMVKMFVGSQTYNGMYHNNMFDKLLMKQLLEKHGFKVILTHYPYPKRPTPSRIVIATKK